MSLVRMGLVFYICCIALISTYVSVSAKVVTQDSLVEQLNEDNWDLMLTGEWMVEFYAPWCPACKALEPIWEHFASYKKSLNINVGKINVISSPGLSGRFMVTALPTIFHVNDGVFRQYKSPRDKDSFIEFVSKKTWTKVEPVSNWKSPTAFHMSILSEIFKLSQTLRAVHTRFLEKTRLPASVSYIVLALGTIMVGGLMGLLIVCIVDLICPPIPMEPQQIRQAKKKQNGTMTTQEKGSDENELSENVGDDLVDESEPEELRETPEQVKGEEVSEPEELEASEKYMDTKADTSSPSVRKRKPRKAD